MHPMLHAAITAILVHVQIGSIVWMFVYSRGSLSRIYSTEPTGSGAVMDFIGDAIITLVLIVGWPAMLIAIAKGSLR